MNRTTLTTSAMMALAVFTLAPAAEAASVAVSPARIVHQIDAARSAQDRLDQYSERFCSVNCRRLEVDLQVVNNALINFRNQVKHGLLDAETSNVDVKRVQHQFEAIRSALGRMKWVASLQKEDRRRRVEIDVSILTQVVQNVENQALNALRAQTK